MNKLTKPDCPLCGGRAVGAVDWIPGTALMNVSDDGTWEWSGETDVHWDGQINAADLEPTSPDGPAFLVQCERGHRWDGEQKERAGCS